MNSIRVLLAVPDKAQLRRYGVHLMQEGFEVMSASDGLDCVAKLRRANPDILVLDPHLLWGGAEGVMARMNEEPDLPLVPVLLLSQQQSRDSRLPDMPCRSSRAAKPFTPARLVQAIRLFL